MHNILQYVTRPTKTGQVGTKYTLSHYGSQLSNGTKYLHFGFSHRAIACCNTLVIANSYACTAALLG